MESFVVVEVRTDTWTDEEKVKVVMQSDSELLCYRQALALQIEESNEQGSPIWISYKVIPDGEQSKMTDLIKKEFIEHFNWKELNGKQLHVIVVEDGGFQSVSLYEENTQKIYVVAVNKLEEN